MLSSSVIPTQISHDSQNHRIQAHSRQGDLLCLHVCRVGRGTQDNYRGLQGGSQSENDASLSPVSVDSFPPLRGQNLSVCKLALTAGKVAVGVSGGLSPAMHHAVLVALIADQMPFPCACRKFSESMPPSPFLRRKTAVNFRPGAVPRLKICGRVGKAPARRWGFRTATLATVGGAVSLFVTQ